MRFEAKHSFFKKTVRQTSFFRNILMTMARKHQSLMAYNLHDSILKPALSVSKQTTVAIEVLTKNVSVSIARTFSGEEAVKMPNRVNFLGTDYCIVSEC